MYELNLRLQGMKMLDIFEFNLNRLRWFADSEEVDPKHLKQAIQMIEELQVKQKDSQNKVLDEVMNELNDLRDSYSGTVKEHENNHKDGYTDACNEFQWVLNGMKGQ